MRIINKCRRLLFIILNTKFTTELLNYLIEIFKIRSNRFLLLALRGKQCSESGKIEFHITFLFFLFKYIEIDIFCLSIISNIFRISFVNAFWGSCAQIYREKRRNENSFYSLLLLF